MRRIKKIILWLFGLLVLFTLLGFFVLPPVLKLILVKKLSENLHRQVTIQKIKINPYALTLDVKGFLVKERSSPSIFLSLDEVFLKLSSLSITKGAIIVEEARIKKPYVQVVRRKDESYNFSDLLEKPRSEPKGKTEPLKFSLNNILISEGSVDFIDALKDTTHTVRNLNITLPSISYMFYDVDIFVQPKLSAFVNGKFFSFQGKTKPFAESLETNLDVSIKDFEFVHYLPYIPMKLNFKLLSGAMDLKGKISFIRYKDKGPSLNFKGNLSFRNLAVDDLENRPLLRFPSIGINITSFKPFAKNFRIAKVILQSPELVVRRGKAGELNLQSLIPKGKETSTKKEKSSVPAQSEESGPPFVTIDALQIQEGKFSFSDAMPSEPVTFKVSNLMFQGDNLSTAKDSKGNLSLSLVLDKQGSLSAKGAIGIDPVSADLSVDMKDIKIPALQPYFTDKVKLNVTNGYFSTTGNLAVLNAGERGFNTTYTGKILVLNFASIDKVNGDDFLKWKVLFLNAVDVGLIPIYLHIGGISLTDFYSRVAINPDGTLNVQKVFEAEKTAKESPQSSPEKKEIASIKTEEREDITIGKITLQGGTIDFSDYKIKPSYSASLNEIGGMVSTISLKQNQPADVELRGRLGSDVPLEIVGKINPSSDNLFVDLTAKFRDLDLSPMTPYSEKYLGYTIEQGKLSLDVKYLVVNRKLDSQNKIFLNQLSFGDKVESPDAIKLPVKLAISLLKDRNGQINLDVPVSGNIDDPQFSVAKVILKVLKNLITKAVTSPFALVGGLFGGGKELSYLEFDYGIAQVTKENTKKIDTLVKALYERPALRLEIFGHVDIEKDRAGLKTYWFNKKIKVQKLNEMIKQGVPAIPIDEVKVEPEEYEKYLTMAYKAEKLPKPRNIIGLPKSLPVSEMEKLMLTNIEIKDDDLRALATQRAMNIKDLILKPGTVTPDRVFIKQPKTLAPKKKENIKDSRINFKLK